MAAHITYEIHGTNSHGQHVSIPVKLLATPPPEVAEFLLHEEHPSATDIYVTMPAAQHYKKPARQKPIQVKKLATTPVRRAG